MPMEEVDHNNHIVMNLYSYLYFFIASKIILYSYTETEEVEMKY